jgi:hypothetical protein
MSSQIITPLPGTPSPNVPRKAVLVSLLALYILIVIITSSHALVWDEIGYVYNANRMVHRLVFPEHDYRFLRLTWGPGYPLVLIPFILIGIPWIVAKLLNAFLLFGAITYFYALLRRYVPEIAAMIFSLCVGLYPPFLKSLHLLMTEPLAVFLVCGFMFHFCAQYNDARHQRRDLFIGSTYLAYLALTKVFFGYVIAASLVFLSIGMAWRRMKALQKALPLFLLAFVWCIPYLLYTYSLTGKAFYWSTAGGMQLYWMTTPDANELGSWFSSDDVRERPELARHREVFSALEGQADTEQDDAFKRQAVFNIVHHPTKFLLNWMANVGRLLFSYPYSFEPQSMKTFLYLVPNMFIVVLCLMSMIPAFARPTAIPFELWAVVAFALIVFGGLTLVSAWGRYSWPLIPAVSFWVAFIYTRVLRVEFRQTRLAADCDKPMASAIVRIGQ